MSSPEMGSETPEEKIRVFQMNRGDFESECRRRGLEPLPFAQWLVLHYLASQRRAAAPPEKRKP